MIWLQFACCAATILIAGSLLSRYGEIIAEKSGFSKGLVGLVLLAMITSLSQLVASISAAVVHDLPDMAVGALTGSCMFNMMLIGMLDLISRDRPVSHMVHEGHILSAGFGIVLMGFAAIDILFGSKLPVLTFIHSMDPITVMFLPIYLFAMNLTFKFERTRLQQLEAQAAQNQVAQSGHSWTKLIAIFVVAALAIIAASYYLPDIAEQIASSTGWGRSFIGSSFVAIATCLPELSVSVASARRGAFDMAVASLLGSNLCYIVILAITDCCYLKGALLRHVSQANALIALSAMISMGIVVVALTYRAEKKLTFIAGDALALLFVYGFANLLLFMSR